MRFSFYILLVTLVLLSSSNGQADVENVKNSLKVSRDVVFSWLGWNKDEFLNLDACPCSDITDTFVQCTDASRTMIRDVTLDLSCFCSKFRSSSYGSCQFCEPRVKDVSAISRHCSSSDASATEKSMVVSLSVFLLHLTTIYIMMSLRTSSGETVVSPSGRNFGG